MISSSYTQSFLTVSLHFSQNIEKALLQSEELDTDDNNPFLTNNCRLCTKIKNF